MRLHIHRWRTVREVDWATYWREYKEPLPHAVPIPAYESLVGPVVGVRLQECRCGRRRSEDIIGKWQWMPRDRWER